MILRTRYVIAVPDLADSAAWYRDVLGFEIRRIEDPGWRFYVRDGCTIMAGECPDAIPPADLGDHQYFAYLVVEDVDVFHRRALEMEAEVTKPPRSEPWGMRELGLRTADGHRITLGAPTTI